MAPVEAKPANDSDIKIEEVDENSEEAEEAAENAADAKAKEANPATYQGGPRIYHISKRANDSKWQVKLASGQIAIKLFDTQAQAIAFAKSLVKTQGGSIRVHSLKGKMRKE